MRWSVIAWLCALAACDGASSGDDAGVEPDGDPYCHWDCFGYQECHDGVVTSWEHTPVPCEYWEGECPHSTSTPCVEGCRIDTDRIDGAPDDPSIMCEENRPKHVGDLCADDTDCRPEVATWDDQGNVTNVYLRCDVDAGMCVARDAPVVADWLATSCGIEPDAFPDSYAYGVREVDTCSGGVCLFYEREDCVAQGCTIRCEGDGECPVGAVCDATVCKPGPPGSIGVDLSCPPAG
jgi:hypothetical protein